MYVIGLDIGTTGAKALLVQEDGKILSKGYRGYGLISDGRKIEQRAEDWSEAGAAAIREALEGFDPILVKAISLSTQGSSTVAIDGNGRTIGNSLTWMDSRSTAEADYIEDKLGGDYIYHTSGWRITATHDAAKIRYMKSCDKYADAKLFLSTLDFMNLYLTGNPIIDPTNASMRQLFNIETNDWDEGLMNASNVTRDELPRSLPTGGFVGGLTGQAAKDLGLTAGTPVFNGAHDQYCASIGAGAVSKGDMLLSAGTTWVVMGIGDKPLFTKSFIAPGKHPVDDYYGAIASLTCSGGSLQWFKNEFISEDFKEIDSKVLTRRDKTKELFYYPYLTGINYPDWNFSAKGAFTGLGLEHDRFDLARAIMEGVAFGVKRTLLDYSENGYNVQKMKLIGGAAKSRTWCQIIASVTGIDIEVNDESDACALGAAMIAAKSIGLFTDYHDAARKMVGIKEVFKADSEDQKYFEDKYKNYQAMWQYMSKYYEK